MEPLSAAYILMKVTDHVRMYHERMEAQMLRAFIEVARNPGISVYDIAHRTNSSGAAVSRNVTKLGPGGPRGVGLELVHRYEDPADRRHKRVQLTDKGQRFFTELASILDEGYERAMKKGD